MAGKPLFFGKNNSFMNPNYLLKVELWTVKKIIIKKKILVWHAINFVNYHMDVRNINLEEQQPIIFSSDNYHNLVLF